MTRCYMCDKPATTKEHVPPKCLFPEQDDIPAGKDYRINLITVPSCEEHNSEKSDDDAYLLAVIVWGIGNNEISRQHIETKVERAFKKNPKAFNFLKTMRTQTINGIIFYGFTFDAKRIEIELEHIARGLYFKEFRKRNRDPLVTMNSLLFEDNVENSRALNTERQDTRAAIERHLQNFPKKGSNQEIFYYQIDQDTKTGLFLLKMVFYEGFEVYAQGKMSE